MFVARKERRLYEAAVKEGRQQEYIDGITEALEKRELVPEDFSVRELFEEFVEDGSEMVRSWTPKSRANGQGVMLSESGVNTAAFANITGQIVYSKTLEAFNGPEFIAGQLSMTIPTQFSGEKIAGIGNIGDEAEAIAEGANFPLAGVSEEWIETPDTVKRGMIVPVTREAIFFDRTGLILMRASQVGQMLGINKEKRVLDCALGVTTSYKRNGTANIATYGDSSGSHDWDNLQASNALVDWTDIENALLLFDGLVDPNTGEPIIVGAPYTVVVPSALVMTARVVLNATQLQKVDMQANATTYRTIGGNPLSGMSFNLVSSAYVKARTSSSSTWFIGDFQGAFAYMENWPLSVRHAPQNSHDEFTRDIAVQYRADERGVPAVLEPRKVVKCTA